jgi:hypothetical protein
MTTIVSQVNVVVSNVIGSLAALGDKLRAADVNINAISCTQGGSKTLVHLIVDEPEDAMMMLQPLYKVTTSEVFAFKMKNKPGSIASIARACAAADISIVNMYATTCGRGKDAIVYVIVDDIAKAREQMKTWEKKFGSMLP